MINVTEMSKLAAGLALNGIPFSFKSLYDGFQIVATKDDWDVVCHSGSYGHETGLLEGLGKCFDEDGDVRGWLSADEALSLITGEDIEDDDYPDEPYDIDDDFGFDPYMGEYTYDC